MMKITCPWCGARGEEEFRYGGPSHLARPENDESLSDGDWADYLVMRDNVKGVSRERWGHIHGCGQWFNMVRDTVSHEIHATYKMGDPPPEGWRS
ncbi:Sarcosine oxidase delta subunit [hydrothermal vent metagenome]|uniref:Sarcosine oxidase delta subunit n=1 Tax=hydrothermal vent metagenome TaxID=652676 RepID=A0A3B0SBT5_9ZZZZ